MADKPLGVEKVGIEHIGPELRHGSPGRTFTLWFAANLTIADYVIGVLTTVYWGFGLAQALPILLVGNLIGGLLLGLAAAMGPSFGYPQMVASRASFGRRGNYIPGALNWISTVGWFTVNTILAVFALQVVVPGASFPLAAAGYVAIQASIAVYGHDFIHLFEKAMSVVLGLLFVLIFVMALPRLPEAFAYVPAGSAGGVTLAAVGLVFVAAFSYLMSWAPYASDYSRYLPGSSSRKKVAAYALLGGGISSFAVEAVGALIGTLTPSQTTSLGFFGGLGYFAGVLAPVAMLTLILGAFAADALNLYTNSLSALVLDIKASRRTTVLVGAIVGFAAAVVVGQTFESFFESFLLALAYWIMPWLAIVTVDYYTGRKATPESVGGSKPWEYRALAIYAASLLASVPFMIPPLAYGYPVGALTSLFGGADLSYFVSFAVAAVLTFVFRPAKR